MEEKRSVSGADTYSADSSLESQVNDKYVPLLTNCFVALKNSTLYPAGHQQIKLSMEEAHKAFVGKLERQDPLIFGVAKDILIFNELPVGPGIQPVTDFTETLNKHDIASLTFHKGVSRKSLISFFQLLSYAPEKAAGEQGIQQELINLGGSHIDITTVDYNLFQLSDQKESGGGVGRRENIWLSFTKRLLRGGFSAIYDHSQDTGDSPSGVTGDPVQLAKFINDNQLDIDLNLESYGLMLDGILGSPTTEARPTAHAQQDTAASGAMNDEEISMVTSMLDGLNPALRKQFLATTLDKCQKYQNNNPPMLLSQLSPKLVIEILDIASRAGREISPTLLSLLQRLAEGQSAGIPHGTGVPSPQEVETLMARERYEDYVDPDYDHMLQILGRSQPPMEPPAGFVREEEEKTFQDAYLITQVTHLMLMLMENTDSEEDYSRYAEKLTEIALDLPSFGIFSLVNTITDMLSRQAGSHPSPVIQELAGKCLGKIEGRDYVESIAALLPDASSADKALAIHALIVRGPLAMSELLDFYCDEKKCPFNSQIVQFFKKYRVECLAEIARRLPRGKPDTILLLLALAKDLGVGGAAPLLRPLLTHHDDSIRAAILDILLPLQDSEAIQYLRDLLRPSNGPAVESALTLAWKYKTAALLPELIALLDYRCLKKSTIQRNGRTILALSGIGDVSALPALERLADSRCVLHPRQAETMKETLFLSLSAYPIHSVIPLCRKGLKSKQPEIRQTCRKLLSRAERAK
ncbi:MAG: HEAT repeat domain-containing protein [Thermodesulfobacteriota bacterium]